MSILMVKTAAWTSGFLSHTFNHRRSRGRPGTINHERRLGLSLDKAADLLVRHSRSSRGEAAKQPRSIQS